MTLVIDQKCYFFQYQAYLRTSLITDEHNYKAFNSECGYSHSWILISFGFLRHYCCCWVAQLCPTLCDPIDCSPPGCFVHGILQTRILQWVAMLSSRGPSWPRDQTCVCCISCLGRQILYHWATWEACLYSNAFFIPNPSEQVFCPFLWFKEVWSCYIGVVFFFFFFFLRYYKFLFEIR